MTDTGTFINTCRQQGAAQLNVRGFSIPPHVPSVLQVADFEVQQLQTCPVVEAGHRRVHSETWQGLPHGAPLRVLRSCAGEHAGQMVRTAARLLATHGALGAATCPGSDG